MYQSTSCKKQGGINHKLESRLQGEISTTLVRYTDDTTLMAKSEEELESLLMNVKEESERAGLKLSIQNTKIMASGPITLQQIYGETMETVRGLFFRTPNSLQMVTAAMKLKDAGSSKEKL